MLLQWLLLRVAWPLRVMSVLHVVEQTQEQCFGMSEDRPHIKEGNELQFCNVY